MKEGNRNNYKITNTETELKGKEQNLQYKTLQMRLLGCRQILHCTTQQLKYKKTNQKTDELNPYILAYTK